MLCVYDAEVFQNFFLVVFYNPAEDTYQDFEFFGTKRHDTEALKEYIKSVTTGVGFNNLRYDNYVIREFLQTGSVEAVNELSLGIISGEISTHKDVFLFPVDVDVFCLLDRGAKLKLYQARMGLDSIVEFKGDFTKALPLNQVKDCVSYCRYDCWSTSQLFNQKLTQAKLKVKTHLQHEYDLPTASMSESDFAERILVKEIKQKLGLNFGTRIPRKPLLKAHGTKLVSDKVRIDLFRSDALKKVYKNVVERYYEFVEPKRSAPGMKAPPPKLVRDLKGSVDVEISGGGSVTVGYGIGGLHTYSSRNVIVNPIGRTLLNVDVASFYPATIKLLEISPTGIEGAFLGTYVPLLEERLKLKAAGNKSAADSIKIVLNATYGRLNYKYSELYDPTAMLKVTLNCQLFFLILIEQFARAGVEIIQVNTDGVLIVPKDHQMNDVKKIMKWWEGYTGYVLESDVLDGALIKDAGNYAWIKGGEVIKEKGKGFQTKLSLTMSCSVPLVTGKAVLAYFMYGTPVKDTVQQSFDNKLWQDVVIFQSKQLSNCEYAGLFSNSVSGPAFELGEDCSELLAAGKRFRILRYAPSLSHTGVAVKGLSSLGAPAIQMVENCTDLNWDDLPIDLYIKNAQSYIDACLPEKVKAQNMCFDW